MNFKFKNKKVLKNGWHKEKGMLELLPVGNKKRQNIKFSKPYKLRFCEETNLDNWTVKQPWKF